jgi:CPA1 family monovalent cation:H+ antiporter
MPLLLGWTGMRGVVSLAAALAIPVTLADGSAFPYRYLILFITFIVILVTLLAQGLTLPYLIKRFHLFEEFGGIASDRETKQKMKRGLRELNHQFLKNKYDNGWQGHSGIQKMLQHWEEKSKVGDDDWINEKTKVILLEMLDGQREYLKNLNKDPSINEEIIRSQLYQIDLEEERLRML